MKSFKAIILLLILFSTVNAMILFASKNHSYGNDNSKNEHKYLHNALAANSKSKINIFTISDRSSLWQVVTPIVTYWLGPQLSDKVAKQMAEGGFNLVWCKNENEMDVAMRYGLRVMLSHDLISTKSLSDPQKMEKLNSLISRVQNHPALYSYFLADEPNAQDFQNLRDLVKYLQSLDSKHLAFINLHPIYAHNRQLGTEGDKINAYLNYLNLYINTVRPKLLSYDHYHFKTIGDGEDYFLNLAIIRQISLAGNIPFLNTIQACSWSESMRIPNEREMRFLVYTTLAYGGQGIGYYVYSAKDHKGGFALSDGTPTPIFNAIKSINREFVAISRELQTLKSIAVYHTGMLPPGTEVLPRNALFRLDPPLPDVSYVPLERVVGILLGYFGQADDKPTHVVVVNLDYRSEVLITLVGPSKVFPFDVQSSSWSRTENKRIDLQLPPGGGKLVRIKE